jgi:hypothetical protein
MEERTKNFTTLWIGMLADPAHNEFFKNIINDQDKTEFLKTLTNFSINNSSNVLNPIKNIRSSSSQIPKPITAESIKIFNNKVRGIRIPISNPNTLITSSILMSKWVARNKLPVLAVTSIAATVVTYTVSSDFREFLSNLKLNSFNKFNKFFNGTHKKK